MAVPTNRNELITYCKRYCGEPVIEVNVASEQIDDAIDDAFHFWREYHYEGTVREYLAHEITQQDIDNKYITLPDGVQAVKRVLNFQANAALSTTSLFNVQYQLRLNDLWDLSRVNISDYWIARQYISLLDDILNPELLFRHEKEAKKLHIDFNWSNETDPGAYLLVELVKYIDIDEHPGIFGNWVLRQLAGANTKWRWGNNLSKFEGIQLPGGVTLNGREIMSEAKEEIQELKQEFIMKYQEPDDFFVG